MLARGRQVLDSWWWEGSTQPPMICGYHITGAPVLLALVGSGTAWQADGLHLLSYHDGQLTAQIEFTELCNVTQQNRVVHSHCLVNTCAPCCSPNPVCPA